MNWLDITLIIATSAGALLGFRSGLVWQALRLLSWLIALWVAGRFHTVFGNRINALPGLSLPSWAAYLILLIGILVLFYLIANLVRTLIDALHLKLLDRLIGAALGAVKVLFIASVIIFYIHLYVERDTFLRNGIEGSFLARTFIGAIEKVAP